MIDLLRDPIWNGIAGIVAIVALVITIEKEKRELIPSARRSIVLLSKVVVGILILLPSPLFRFTIVQILQGGIPQLQSVWLSMIAPLGIFGALKFYIIFAFSPGLISSLVASTGKTLKQSTIRAVIAIIVVLTVEDIYLYTRLRYFGAHNDTFLIDLVCNIICGLIGGPIVAITVKSIDKAFSQSSSNNNAG